MAMRMLSSISRFRRQEDGVALVEFAIFLPVFVLAFFVIVEFSRVFFSYQTAIVGVRDAARYMARVAPPGVCEDATATSGGGNPVGAIELSPVGTGTANVAGADAARTIIERNMDTETSALPVNVFLDDVTATYFCEIGAPGDYRQDNVPVAQVSASFRIVLPLIGILEINNIDDSEFATITRTVTDSSRIFGY